MIIKIYVISGASSWHHNCRRFSWDSQTRRHADRLTDKQTQIDKLFWRKIVAQRAIAANATYATYARCIGYIPSPWLPMAMAGNNLALHGSLSPLASKWNQMLHRRQQQPQQQSAEDCMLYAACWMLDAASCFSPRSDVATNLIGCDGIRNTYNTKSRRGPIHLCHLYARVTSERSGSDRAASQQISSGSRPGQRPPQSFRQRQIDLGQRQIHEHTQWMAVGLPDCRSDRCQSSIDLITTNASANCLTRTFAHFESKANTTTGQPRHSTALHSTPLHPTPIHSSPLYVYALVHVHVAGPGPSPAQVHRVYLERHRANSKWRWNGFDLNSNLCFVDCFPAALLALPSSCYCCPLFRVDLPLNIGPDPLPL